MTSASMRVYFPDIYPRPLKTSKHHFSCPLGYSLDRRGLIQRKNL